MANTVNIEVDQGSNLEIQINVTDSSNVAIDLSTYTCESKIRKNPYTNTAYTFTCNSFANGLITLNMNSVNSANVPAGRYIYDVEMTSAANTTTRVQEGLIAFNPNITR